MVLDENRVDLFGFLHRRHCCRDGGRLDQVAVQILRFGVIVYSFGPLDPAIDWQDARQTVLLDTECILLGVLRLLFLENGRYRGNRSDTGMGKRKVASKDLVACVDEHAKKR